MNSEHKNIADKLIDIELAKKTNNTKIRKYFPAAVFATTFYYSSMIAIGLAVGYLGSKILSAYLLDSGKIGCIYIGFGKKWKLHLHHWITGSLLLLVAWVIDFFYLPRFFLGVLIGIIAHDIYDYNDWHKVLVRKEEK